MSTLNQIVVGSEQGSAMPPSAGQAPAAASTAGAPPAAAPAPAADPFEDYRGLAEAFKTDGMTADQVRDLVDQARYLQTPEGQQQLMQTFEQQQGDRIFKARLAESLKVSENRRALKRWLGMMDEQYNRQPQTPPAEPGYGEEPQQGVPPQILAQLEDMRNRQLALEQQLQEARGTALEAKNTVNDGFKAMSYATTLQTIASQTPAAAAQYDRWTGEVMAKVQKQPARYQGMSGLKRASDEVLQDWSRIAVSLGFAPPTSTTPPPSTAAGAPVAQGILPDKAKELVASRNFDAIADLIAQSMVKQTR